MTHIRYAHSSGTRIALSFALFTSLLLLADGYLLLGFALLRLGDVFSAFIIAESATPSFWLAALSKAGYAPLLIWIWQVGNCVRLLIRLLCVGEARIARTVATSSAN